MDGFRFALAKRNQKEPTNDLMKKIDNYNFSSLKIPLETATDDNPKVFSTSTFVPNNASDIATPESMQKTTMTGKTWHNTPTPESQKLSSMGKPWPWSGSAPSSEPIVIRDTYAEDRVTPVTSAPTSKKKRKHTAETPDPPPKLSKAADHMAFSDAIRSSELSLLSAMKILSEEKEKLKIDLDSRQSELVSVRGELADKASSLKELQFKVSNFNKLLEKLTTEQSLFRQYGDKLKSSTRELNDEASNLKAEFATRRDEMQAIKRDEADYFRQNHSYDLLKSRAEELVGQLSEERDRVVSLESDMSGLRIELRKYADSEKAGLVQDLTKRELVENEVNERLASIASRVSKWDTDMTLTEMSQDVRSAVSQIQQFQAETMQLHQNQFEERLKALQKEQGDLSTVVSIKDERITALESEQDNSSRRLKEAKIDIQHLESTISDLEIEKKNRLPEDELPLVKQLRNTITEVNKSLVHERTQTQSLRQQNSDQVFQHKIINEKLSKAGEVVSKLEQDLNTALVEQATSRKESQLAVQAEIAAHEGRLRRDFNLEVAEYQNHLKQRDHRISQLQSQLTFVNSTTMVPKVSSSDPNERIVATPEDIAKKPAMESAQIIAIGDIEQEKSPDANVFAKERFESASDKKSARTERRRKSITYTAQPKHRRGLRNGSK